MILKDSNPHQFPFVSGIYRRDKMFTWHTVYWHMMFYYKLVMYSESKTYSDKRRHYFFALIFMFVINKTSCFKSCFLVLLRCRPINKWEWCVYLLLCSQMFVIPWTRAQCSPTPFSESSCFVSVPLSIQRGIIGSFTTPGPHSSRWRDKCNHFEPWPLSADNLLHLSFKRWPQWCDKKANGEFISVDG